MRIGGVIAAHRVNPGTSTRDACTPTGRGRETSTS